MAVDAVLVVARHTATAVTPPTAPTHGGATTVSYRVIRDATVTAVALGILIFEVVFGAAPRPEVLLLVGSLLAVPAFLRVDDKLRGGKEEK